MGRYSDHKCFGPNLSNPPLAQAMAESQSYELDAVPATQLDPEDVLPPADDVESNKKRKKEEFQQGDPDRLKWVGDLCFVQEAWMD